MGSWGTGPFDNDGAQSWLATKLKPLVEKGLKSKDMQVVVAALGLAAVFPHDLLGGALRLSDDELAHFFARIRHEDAKNGWRNPMARKRAMAALRRALGGSDAREKLVRSVRKERSSKKAKTKTTKKTVLKKRKK